MAKCKWLELSDIVIKPAPTKNQHDIQQQQGLRLALTFRADELDTYVSALNMVNADRRQVFLRECRYYNQESSTIVMVVESNNAWGLFYMGNLQQSYKIAR